MLLPGRGWGSPSAQRLDAGSTALGPTNAGEPSTVMRPHERVDPVANGCVGACEQIRVHADFVT